MRPVLEAMAADGSWKKITEIDTLWRANHRKFRAHSRPDLFGSVLELARAHNSTLGSTASVQVSSAAPHSHSSFKIPTKSLKVSLFQLFSGSRESTGSK